MDIAGLSMNMSQTKVAASVNILMMKKALDKMQSDGADLAEMIQQTAVGIDIKA